MTEVTRYWCPHDGVFHLDERGYLADPGATFFGRSRNPSAIATADLAAERCVVLLGEPGAGKSTVLDEHSPLLPAGVAAAVVRVDLGVYGSEDRLVREVLDAPPVRSWLGGDGELCIVADGFDEGAARLPNLALILADRVARWPVGRLWLRIACRTADWPTSLGDTLRRSFAHATVVELLPLRRTDVAALAAGWAADGAFLDEVEDANAVPFATRPLTLRLLAAGFAATGSLPGRGADLFDAGLAALAEEQNPARLDTGLRGTLTASQRLAVAARIAAATTFGGRQALWTGPSNSPDRDPATDVPVETIAGGAEPHGDGGDTVDVTPAAVRETVAAGLFTSRGDQRLGWAHTTFGDFLAARWLVTNGVAVDQARPLFLAADDRTFPQTRLAAAWALAMRPVDYAFLARADPEALRGEVGLPGDNIRAVVVDGLFAVADAGRLRDRWGANNDVLCHDGIAEQIRPQLSSPTPASRRLAFRLAADCTDERLRADLVAVALDSDRPEADRVAAAWAIVALNTASAPGDDLLPLVTDPRIRGDDPRDELLGVALLASWPHAIATAEVLDHITRPQADRYGMYHEFIRSLAAGLTAADLPAATAWLDPHIDTSIDDRLTSLVNATLKLAIAADDDASLDVAVRFAIARARAYDGLYLDEYGITGPDPLDDGDLRRRLVDAVLAQHPDKDVIYAMADQPGGHGLAIVRGDDLAWLAARYAAAAPEDRSPLATLFRDAFDWNRRDHIDLALDMPPSHPLHVDLVAQWVAPDSLADPIVTKRREAWRSAQRRRDDAEEPDDLDDELINQLNRFEAGDPIGFWHGVRIFYARPNGSLANEHDPDLTKTRRWQRLPEEDRARFVAAAERFLRTGSCDAGSWLGQRKWHYPSMAAYRGMVLLLRRDPSKLDALPPPVWREWAPVILDWAATVNGAQWDDKRAILDRAAPVARRQLADAIVTIIRAADERDDHAFLHAEISYLWDAELGTELHDVLRDAASAKTRDLVARTIAEHDIGLARPTLYDWLKGTDTEPAVLAGALLLDHDVAESWPHLAAVLDNDTDLAVKTLAASATVRERRVPPVGATEHAELYGWLVRRFPHSEDPHELGAHFVGPREEIAHWRDRILDELRGAGTEEAVDAVAGLAQRLPTLDWLAVVHADAQDALRHALWQPTTVSDLRRLAVDRSARLVSSPAELCDVVEAALRDVQRRLQGDTPEAPQLWDTAARRPKEEDALSDYLQNRLTDVIGGRGVVANREVQIRRTAPRGIGERLDLRIDAVAADAGRYRTITVPVELKCAWHRDIDTAMREQLVDKYLADLHSRHGVYAVGWFDPTWWQAELAGLGTDARRARVARRERDELHDLLTRQAQRLKGEGYEIRVVMLDCSFDRPT